MHEDELYELQANGMLRPVGGLPGEDIYLICNKIIGIFRA